MIRRFVDAFALLAFPLSIYVAGWLLPRTDPLSGAIVGAPVAVMAATVILGAATSVALAIVGRRMRAGGGHRDGPEAVRWLITGWPLPMPRWRSRTGPALPPPATTSPGAPVRS